MSIKLTQYLETYAGKQLLKQHKLDDSGIWRVLGEDSNCDLGGAHHRPNLGVYEGTLRDVITLAVDLPMFWTWGAGGTIESVPFKKINADTIQRERVLREQLAQLEKQIKEIKQELGEQ